MANISQKDMKTTLKVFLLPDFLFINNNHFHSWKILQVMFFGGRTNTLPTLSHVQNITMWNITF